MISLVYKNINNELDALVLCNDSKIVDVVRQLDGVKEYKIISYMPMDCATSVKVGNLINSVNNFKYLYKQELFAKLSDEEKKIIQGMLDAFDEVQRKVI